MVMPMSELNPEVLDNIDFDETVRAIHDSLQVPAEIINSRGDVESARTERAEMQQAMQQAQLMEQVGKGAQAAGAGAEALQGAGV